MADRIRRENPPPIRCGARARSTGEPCKRWAIPGATRCKLHGGLAGRGGRARAEELHTARRIEALVTDFASRVMIESGFPVEVVRMAGGQVPAPDPDEESTPSLTDDDEEAALNASMARLIENLTARFQGATAELARQQAQVAASRPATIEGEAVDAEAVPALQEAVPTAQEAVPTAQEADPVAEEIEALERRFTTARAARSARLRRPREVVTHLPEPEPAPTAQEPAPTAQGPAPTAQEPAPTPEPEPDPGPAQELTVKRQPAPRRGPRRDAKGRIVTTLGLKPDNWTGSYRTFT